ncbi:MAG: hypothetical protein WCE73_09775 [Candidatus Angelobacter sp.]
MKDELDKAAKALTVAELIYTGIIIMVAVIILLGRAIYLAYR